VIVTSSRSSKNHLSGQLNRCNWPMHRRFNRCMYFHRSSFGNAPTYAFSSTSVNPVSVSSVSSFWTITPACVFSLTSVQPVYWISSQSLRFLSFGPKRFQGAALRPAKPGNVFLDNHISPSVACVINRQNIILKYGMRGHFRYNQPILYGKFNKTNLVL